MSSLGIPHPKVLPIIATYHVLLAIVILESLLLICHALDLNIQKFQNDLCVIAANHLLTGLSVT